MEKKTKQFNYSNTLISN